MRHFLMDTNVVIDFLADRKPFALPAARLFDSHEKGKVKLYISAFSYNNMYYILKKLTSHKETIRILKELEKLSVIVDTTGEAIQNALHSEFKDFEDAIQHSTALGSKRIEAIVTRNTADFNRSKLPVLTPEEAVGLLGTAGN